MVAPQQEGETTWRKLERISRTNSKFGLIQLSLMLKPCATNSAGLRDSICKTQRSSLKSLSTNIYGGTIHGLVLWECAESYVAIHNISRWLAKICPTSSNWKEIETSLSGLGMDLVHFGLSAAETQNSNITQNTVVVSNQFCLEWKEWKRVPRRGHSGLCHASPQVLLISHVISSLSAPPLFIKRTPGQSATSNQPPKAWWFCK